MKASKKLLRTQDEIIREEREVSIDIILKALLGRGRGNGLRFKNGAKREHAI